MSRLLTKSEAETYAQLVSNYRPKQAVVERFTSSKFAVIAGPAGAGKDTLRDSLIGSYPTIYNPILSTTTRPPRMGEINHQTYHFCELEEFDDKLAEQSFLQIALVHQQQLSGLHISDVDMLSDTQWGLSILIVQTEVELRAYHPDLKTIFVIPPTVEILRERIHSERMLNEDEVTRRLQAACSEINQALDTPHYYCVVSDNVASITVATHRYLQDGILDQGIDTRARQCMRDIMQSINNES